MRFRERAVSLFFRKISSPKEFFLPKVPPAAGAGLRPNPGSCPQGWLVADPEARPPQLAVLISVLPALHLPGTNDTAPASHQSRFITNTEGDMAPGDKQRGAGLAVMVVTDLQQHPRSRNPAATGSTENSFPKSKRGGKHPGCDPDLLPPGAAGSPASLVGGGMGDNMRLPVTSPLRVTRCIPGHGGSHSGASSSGSLVCRQC